MKDFINNLPAWFKVALVILIIVAIILIVRFAIVKYKARKAFSLTEENIVNTTVNGQPVSVNIGTAAGEIYEAFHGSWYSEDEARAVAALIRVPKSAIPNLKTTYFKLYDKQLTNEFQKYLSAEEYLFVRNILEGQ